MSSPPLVTVVISLYNYGRFIDESVRSVLTQTHENLQLVVVDNGSTDDGAQRLAAVEDPRLERLSFEKNQGISRALNLGYTRARGEWVAFLPADDRMHPDFIKHMLAAGERTNCDLVGCWQRVIDGDGNPDPVHAAVYEPANNHESFDMGDFRQFRWANPLNHNLFLWKRSLADKCMPMQEGVIPCDWGMFLRASKAGCRLELVHEKLLDYRVHGNNLGFRTPSQEYLIHFFYLHLTEYRLTAVEMSEDPELELRTCHEELVRRVRENVEEPAVQARIAAASETGVGTLEQWPDLDSFKKHLLEARPSDLRLATLEGLFTVCKRTEAERQALVEELGRSKERVQRLREELDGTKIKVDRLRGERDAASKEGKSRSRSWIKNLFRSRSSEQ